MIIVTGGGRGLGRAHALFLAGQGAHVVVNDLRGDEDPAQAVVDEIVATGGSAIADHNSVTGWDSAAALIQTAVSSFGRLDGLVCNAGFLRDRMLVNMSEAEWDDIVKVHQYGTFLPLRHAAEYWRNEHKAGRPVDASVVTTTAAAGLHGNIGQVNYSAAKAAIAVMTLNAARELARYDVRVNSISPLARTRLTEKAFGEPDQAGANDLAPHHISPLVGWLLASDCTVTAQVYAVHNREIHRYQTWTAQEAAHASADWTIDSVEQALAPWPSQFVPTPIPGLEDHGK
ncbi:SDR family NAD(P)-dependent oxidoreductase [Sphingomonas tagetis]|uniref:SDR family NAD(P)-dependent oxidoreductase n=1 Tax=Sphingomonas tagetis TaxID=2949092 RepID=UPI0020B64835